MASIANSHFTVGPVIDLYGKFAALKLEVIMKKFPGRVFSKPEFTALPPFIFSGAEFALIPSRDEPFGLVAVEFGRKGALGIGARVGGLGQMVTNSLNAFLVKIFLTNDHVLARLVVHRRIHHYLTHAASIQSCD
jgi:glycogen synthase